MIDRCGKSEGQARLTSREAASTFLTVLSIVNVDYVYVPLVSSPPALQIEWSTPTPTNNFFCWSGLRLGQALLAACCCDSNI